MQSFHCGRCNGHWALLIPVFALFFCPALHAGEPTPHPASLARWNADIPEDPLKSSQWPSMYIAFLGSGQVVFDPRVEVVVPAEAEDSLRVPVAVRFDQLPDAEELLVFVDYNPIPKVLQFYPGSEVQSFLGFAVRLQQSSPVRAAVRTKDGVWHVNGAWVDAAGGGCTLPQAAVSTLDIDRIGQVKGRVFAEDDGGSRLKFYVNHPMDTGLVAGIPSYYIEELSFTDGAGRPLARLTTYEPVSANPVFTLDLKGSTQDRGVAIAGRDNNGLTIEAHLP
ncbi:MAG: quinoprotein dehydrogenase-associated SoxYZ-like carrier [Candidatus Competibacterales bacterium]